MPNNNYHVTNLDEWFKDDHDDNERRELFLYMDFAMKYCHERGYCIKSFNPKEIEILNNSIKQVKFNTLIKMPDDSIYQTKLKNEDILNSSLLQVGLYANCLRYINPEYVKDNYDSFLPFLPETDAPYYRGVIERGASVYFTEFERNKNILCNFCSL